MTILNVHKANGFSSVSNPLSTHSENRSRDAPNASVQDMHADDLCADVLMAGLLPDHSNPIVLFKQVHRKAPAKPRAITVS